MIRIKMQNKYYQPYRLMLYFYNNESFFLHVLYKFRVIFYYGNLFPFCVSLKTIDSFYSFALLTEKQDKRAKYYPNDYFPSHKRFLIYRIHSQIYITRGYICLHCLNNFSENTYAASFLICLI